MQVQFQHGIHLPGPGLWLDPHAPQSMAVVSHAHADHVQRHDDVVASVPTAAMMRLRGVTRCRFRTLPYGRPLDLDGARVTLYPAGHILGSAQVLVEWEGTRLLYSGDFKLRPCRSAEAVEVPRADVVIMETTFGRPRYRFPETAAVVEQIRHFCSSALEDGCAPVLFCYSLGKGQEVLACLEGLEHPIYLHSAHWDMASLYKDFGVSLPPFRKYQPGQHLDGVLLCASGCRKAQWYSGLKKTRTAYISGWAVDSGASWRFKTDAAFPLSDHADYDDLLEYVERTGAHSIYTVHGFADEFAGDLRKRGLWAEPLREPGLQLSLF
ncbi:MAG TPA: MBL fold metallo-hydrolase [Armatimonadota bacterium]|nr:MBL fold metallo-hydrolase [Armatimonadota bacterium]